MSKINKEPVYQDSSICEFCGKDPCPDGYEFCSERLEEKILKEIFGERQ